MIRLAPLLSLLIVSGCSTTYPNLDPTGKAFPAVAGKDLDGKPHRLPTEHAGEPVLYLVGTVQETQFDIDRWLVGLLQTKTPVRFLEVPTIPGLFPSAFLKGTINDGMREGIPSEDWGGVVTLYDEDAERVVRFTGNETPRNARVFLLDGAGEVVWFHDRGYSPRLMLELDREVRARQAAPAPAQPAPAQPAPVKRDS